MDKKNLQKPCLQALENVKTDHPIIIKITAKADCLRKRNFSIFQVICVLLVTRKQISLQKKHLNWIFQSEIMHPFCDVRPVINSYINDMWQMELDKYENKLYETNPSVRFFFS